MIDASRHNEVFDPGAFYQRRVDVIGVGATGSKLALSLAKLGVQNLHVWDFDTVEEHNLANQAYTIYQLGMNKASAIYSEILTHTNTPLTQHTEGWNGESLGEFVFVTVDTMSTRRAVMEALKYKGTTTRVFDPRMGASHGQLYSYDPNLTVDIRAYEATLFSDDDAQAELSACGTAITVGPTGDVLVGLMAWQFINAVAGKPTPWLAVDAQSGAIATLKE